MSSFFGPRSRPEAEAEAEPEPKVEVGLHLDSVEQWRFDRLIEAGYSDTQALFIAIDRSRPDLHEAVELARKAGPDLAYRIISA